MQVVGLKRDFELSTMPLNASMEENEFSDVKPVVISCVIVLNITMNSILIALLIKFAELRQDRTVLFMLSLSVSDLAAGCSSMPISAALCSRATPTVRTMTEYLPKINMFCIWFFGFASQHSQSWVALSKMVAILRPLKYEQLFSRNRCYGIIVFNWVVGSVLAGSRLALIMEWDNENCTSGPEKNNATVSILSLVGYAVSVVLPELALIYATVQIFIVVVRVHRHVSAQVQSISGGSANSGLVTLKAVRSARNILVICFVALALTVPLLVSAVLRFAVQGKDIVTRVGFYAVWSFQCNSFLNSFLYIVLHRTLRQKVSITFVAAYEFIRCRRG